ncbi:MAG: NUDIX domain-containing protein [Gammaproteobacteria bacterium]|nr:NUDIX domain-containing protein [Gammaproteobacteria bacterium]
MDKSSVDMARYTVNVVVHTLVWHADEMSLLLLQRANTGLMDGRYTLPGGHLKPGESMLDAAQREVQEEVGIVLGDTTPTCVLPYAGGVNFVFESLRWTGEARNMEPEKCVDLAWCPLERLPRNVVPWLRTVLDLRDSGRWFHDFSGNRS